MKLVVCYKNIDTTLQQGDLISWHEDGEFEGQSVGLYNYLKYGKGTKDEYLATTPFITIDAPLITYEDIRIILEDVDLIPLNLPFVDDNFARVRKWKLDLTNSELREQNTFYIINDVSFEKLRWLEVLPEPIRRDTLNAYLEITLPTAVIADILVPR